MYTENEFAASLPYADGELNLTEAEKLIAEELTKFTNKHTVEKYVPFKDQPHLKEMLEKVGSGSKTTAIDTARFMMSAPADGDFKKSVQNAKSHIEYQRSRMTTLELGIKFGNDQWRIHNFKMEKTIESLKRKNEEVNDQKNKIMNLRKQDQLHAKKTLDSLNSKAHELAPAIISVRLANEQIKKRTGQ